MGRTRVMLHLIYNEVARRALLGQTAAEIGQAMRLHEEYVQHAMRRPDFKEVLSDIEKHVYGGLDQQLASEKRNLRDEILEAAYDSFDRLRTLLGKTVDATCVEPKLQVDIAQDLLDRAGYGKTQKVEQVETLRVDPVTASVLTAALRREQEGRALMGDKELVKPVSKAEHPIAKRMEEFKDKDGSDTNKKSSE